MSHGKKGKYFLKMLDVDGDGIPDSLIEGTSMLYRFRFNSSGTPTVAADGCADSCSGWSIDDVALNNDDPDVGYYTNFDSFTIPWVPFTAYNGFS